MRMARFQFKRKLTFILSSVIRQGVPLPSVKTANFFCIGGSSQASIESLLFKVWIPAMSSSGLPWVRTCLLQEEEVENFFPQPAKEQEKGFSPVWDLRCCLRALFWFHLFPQPGCSQTKGFSPVWIRVWMRRWAGLKKDFPQPGWIQVWGLVPWWWPLVWSTRFLLELNSRMHPFILQRKFFPQPSILKSPKWENAWLVLARTSRDIKIQIL